MDNPLALERVAHPFEAARPTFGGSKIQQHAKNYCRSCATSSKKPTFFARKYQWYHMVNADRDTYKKPY
jgi:hypothetical protein